MTTRILRLPASGMRMAHPHRIGRVLVLTLGLLSAVTVGAQTPPQPTKPAESASRVPDSDFKLVLEPKAIDLLKAVGTRLAAAKSMSFTATVGYEYPSRLGPPIVYTTRYEVTMRRPDKLKVVIPGDGPASELYYDGKAMLAFVPAENLVAVADAPPTLDAALKAAYESAGIYYPFTDLIVADPYAALAEGAKLAFYVGPSGVVGGTQTDMVAWADDDVFLQIWVGVKDKLPRRIRAVYRSDPLRLRHEMELSNWKLDVPTTAKTFVSEKAKSAKRMAFKHPVAAPPPGVKPLTEPKRSATEPAPSQSQSR